MVAYRDLRAAQPQLWLAAAEDWNRLGTQIHDTAVELRVGILLTLAEWWQASAAAEAATAKIETAAKQLESLGTDISAVSSTLINLADRITQSRALLAHADQYAAAHGLVISPDGAITFAAAPPAWSDGLDYGATAPLQALIDQAVQQATGADQAAHAAFAALTLVPEGTDIGAGRSYLNDTGLPIPPELAQDYRPLDPTPWWNLIALSEEKDAYDKLYAAQYALRDLKGAGLAAALLGHWLDRSGTAVRIDPAAMIKDVVRFRTQVNKQIQIGLTTAGTFDSGWISDAVSTDIKEHDPGPNVLDWYYALDGYQYRVHGTVTTVSGRKVATVTVELFKRYNFGNPNGGTPHPDVTAAGGVIDLPQNNIALLNSDGLAKDFNVWGTTTFQVAG
jgi:hypothetical protein